MTNIIARFFSSKSEIIPEVVISYMHKLPDEVAVAFKKEGGLILGRIQLKDEEDPIYIQARNPVEFTKMLNEAIYIAFDFKSEYIDFFHEKIGDRYEPSPKARKALEELFGGEAGKGTADFQSVFDFERNETPDLVPATT